jgi:hypothetical protein
VQLDASASHLPYGLIGGCSAGGRRACGAQPATDSGAFKNAGAKKANSLSLSLSEGVNHSGVKKDQPAPCEAASHATPSRILLFGEGTRNVSREARLKLPALPRQQTVYIPEADSQGGANDHLAFGERVAMGRYLNRVEHVMRALDADVRRGLTNTESFLALAMRHDSVDVVRLREWMYCLHTHKNMLAHFNIRGCIGRVRCRTHCKALSCSLSGLKSGDCTCLDASCAAVASNRSNRGWPNWGL